MSVPVHRRPYDAFLSHAHADRQFVDELYRWLGDCAGFNIWYDAVRESGGGPIGSDLQSAIEQCRNLLLVGSPEAIEREWVKRELAVAQIEQTNSPDFRIIPLRISDAEVDRVNKGYSWIPLSAPTLDSAGAVAILRAFYPMSNIPNPRNTRDVYVSGSWQTDDNASSIAVSHMLSQSGFRLIGDAKDQRGFKSNRIQSIIESCGAFVGIIPYRDNEPSATADGKPYKYFLTELDLATRANIPTLVVADPRVRRVDGDDSTWLWMDTAAQQCPIDVKGAIDNLWNRWIRPPRDHYIFLAADLSSPAMTRNGDLRELIERITGMPTIIGSEILEADLQSAIMSSITKAFLVIADIGDATAPFNLDVCIEAGMALATERNVELLAKGPMRSPPFMLRSRQLTTYLSELEQLGTIHRLVRPYRRRVVNTELGYYRATHI